MMHTSASRAAALRLRCVGSTRCISGASWTSHRRAMATSGPSVKVSVPSEAEVVVVGGGSIGSAVLYHLAKDHGVKAILLESNSLTAVSW